MGESGVSEKEWEELREEAHSRGECEWKLGGIIHELGKEEREVLMIYAERLLLGQKQYGKLDLVNDERDFEKDTLEEVIDRSDYSIFNYLRRKKREERDAR